MSNLKSEIEKLKQEIKLKKLQILKTKEFLSKNKIQPLKEPVIINIVPAKKLIQEPIKFESPKEIFNNDTQYPSYIKKSNIDYTTPKLNSFKQSDDYTSQTLNSFENNQSTMREFEVVQVDDILDTNVYCTREFYENEEIFFEQPKPFDSYPKRKIRVENEKILWIKNLEDYAQYMKDYLISNPESKNSFDAYIDNIPKLKQKYDALIITANGYKDYENRPEEMNLDGPGDDAMMIGSDIFNMLIDGDIYVLNESIIN